NARGGYDDSTPLHTAAWADKANAIAALLDAGADIDAVSGPMHHNEPIGWAIVSGATNAFGILRARGATIRDHHVETAPHGAAGGFQQFNPRRPLEAWREIARVVTKS